MNQLKGTAGDRVDEGGGRRSNRGAIGDRPSSNGILPSVQDARSNAGRCRWRRPRCGWSRTSAVMSPAPDMDDSPAPPLQPAHPAGRARPGRAAEIRRGARADRSAWAASARLPRNSSRPQASARSRSATPTTSTSPTCSGRSSTRPPDIGTRRSTRPRSGSRRSIPKCASSASPARVGPAELGAACRAPPTSCSTAATTSRRAMPSIAPAWRRHAAGVRRGDPLRRPDRGLRRARSGSHPATTASSAKARRWRRRAARRWACSRRSSGIVGATQAAEALKLIAGAGDAARGPAAPRSTR